MYTSVALFALAFAGEAPTAAPQWHTDYALARQRGQKEGKPLAVFVSSGQNGYGSVSREGKLSADVLSNLGSYVCVYVDTSKPAGRKLADALEITGRGLVISDRTGNSQALNHNGDLTNADLTRSLERFANGGYSGYTQTNVTTRVSYYPSNGTAAPAFRSGRSC